MKRGRVRIRVEEIEVRAAVYARSHVAAFSRQIDSRGRRESRKKKDARREFHAS